MRHFLAVVCLALGLAACAADPVRIQPGPLPPGCALTPIASAPLIPERNFMLVPVRIDGQDATMLLDTGAETTTVTPAAAERLGLPADGKQPSMLRGVSGNVRSQNVLVRELSLGGQVVRAAKSAGVGDLPPFPGVSPPVAGLLGADVLAGFEAEIDLPGRTLTLYRAVGCNGFTPWPQAAAVPFRKQRGGLVILDARVDGRRVRAMLDTGARTTLITRETAETLGVSAAALDQDRRTNGVGIGLASIAFRQHRFAELGVPGDLVAGMTVDVADMRLPGVEMLLGADYLSLRHVWISYSTGRVFLLR